MNQAVRKLREALRDRADSPRFLETIPRRGYRFLVPVEEELPGALSTPAESGVDLLSPSTPQGITVGRRRELARLSAVLKAAKESGPQMLCIAGEPGIGKTTLVEAFLAEPIPSVDCHVARGRCSECLAGAEAYLPILEGLESLTRGPCGDAVRKILIEAAPAWYVQTTDFRSRSLPPAAVAADTASASQERKKREFVLLLEALSQSGP